MRTYCVHRELYLVISGYLNGNEIQKKKEGTDVHEWLNLLCYTAETDTAMFRNYVVV